jgi:hypothetical protein
MVAEAVISSYDERTPAVGSSPGAEASQHEQALIRQRHWIERHLADFLPSTRPPDHYPFFERFKPVGELALALYALAGPAHRCEPLRGWALEMARQMTPALEREAAALDWQALQQRRLTSHHVAIALLVYPLLETVTGHRFHHHEEIEQITAWGTPCESMEACFLAGLFAQEDRDEFLWEGLETALISIQSGGRCSASPLYDLTHALFFLTWFGRRLPARLSQYQAQLNAHLGELTLSRLQRNDYDLGAELLTCQLYVGRPADEQLQNAVTLLAAAVQADGTLPAPHAAEGREPFAWCYHTTLVGFLALGTALHPAISFGME